MPEGPTRLCRDSLDNVDLRYDPVEEVVGALCLQLTQLREVGRIGQYGVEELVHRRVGGIHLAGQTGVESLLLVAVQTGRENPLLDEVVVGEDVAHVVGVGVELLDDRRNDDHVHRIVYARHLDEGGVDRIGVFERSGHLVREEDEFRVGQIVQIDHLAVAVEGFAHGLALLVVPLLTLRAADESCGEESQQGGTE